MSDEKTPPIPGIPELYRLFDDIPVLKSFRNACFVPTEAVFSEDLDAPIQKTRKELLEDVLEQIDSYAETVKKQMINMADQEKARFHVQKLLNEDEFLEYMRERRARRGRGIRTAESDALVVNVPEKAPGMSYEDTEELIAMMNTPAELDMGPILPGNLHVPLFNRADRFPSQILTTQLNALQAELIEELTELDYDVAQMKAKFEKELKIEQEKKTAADEMQLD